MLWRKYKLFKMTYCAYAYFTMIHIDQYIVFAQSLGINDGDHISGPFKRTDFKFFCPGPPTWRP